MYMYTAIGHVELPEWSLADALNSLDYQVTDLSRIQIIDVADAVKSKLASIDTSQSVELMRFVALTAHELAHKEISWAEFEKPKPLLYDAYGLPTNVRPPQTIASIIDRVTEEYFQIFQSSISYHVHKLFLLDLVFKLIDKVVDYWNEVALARRAWKTSSGALRKFLEGVLRFKPFHTPLRLFPNSIHPIGSAT
jgi:hypothetical protein